MFGKGNSEDGAGKVAAALDPAFTNRQWSVLDNGTAARQRDVRRAYEQILLTEQLLTAQQETNRLLRELLSR